MALKKPTTTAAANTFADKFEDESSVATTTSAPWSDETGAADSAADNAAAAHVEATTAVAKASATSVSTNDAIARAKGFQKEVEAMKGSADFSWGTHRVFKAKDGVIKEMNGEKLKLGRWVKVQMLAWDSHSEISPGEEGKSSAEFVAYAKDGKTIDYVIGDEQKKYVGSTVTDYLAYLKTEEDFDRASKRDFIDVQCAVLDCEDQSEFHEIIQITLSSSSIPAFKQYQNDLNARSKCAAMGLPGYSVPENPFQFFFIREDAANNKNQTWTKLAIKTNLPAKF